MRRRQHDERLCFPPYCEALEGVETQFALVRFILKQSRKSVIQQFFKERLATLLAKVDDNIGKVKDHPSAKGIAWDEIKENIHEYAQKQHRKQNRAADNRFKIELSEDRLNQSELLLLVAHFESFMKEVHRTFLNAAPTKVFSGRDTKVLLRDVFDSQTGNPFGKFLKELIIKEVKWLDTRSIEKRAEYF